MKEISFLTDYQSATHLTYCQASNFIERLKYGDYFIKESSVSEKNHLYSSEYSAKAVWDKLVFFVETRNRYQDYLKYKSHQDTIKEFEDVEGKNVANIFSEAKYENVYDDCPIGPHSFYDFTNLNTDYDKPFRNYVRKHFNINANFNHIHISLPNHLKFYDDKTGNYYYPESYNMVSLLVQYIFLKIGERFSYIQGFTIDVPRLRLV